MKAELTQAGRAARSWPPVPSEARALRPSARERQLRRAERRALFRRRGLHSWGEAPDAALAEWLTFLRRRAGIGEAETAR